MAFFVSSLHAAETGSSDGRFLSEMDAMKTRLTAIEAQQREILAKEDKILEELDRVRIWVHRK